VVFRPGSICFLGYPLPAGELGFAYAPLTDWNQTPTGLPRLTPERYGSLRFRLYTGGYYDVLLYLRDGDITLLPEERADNLNLNTLRLVTFRKD